LDWPIQCYSRRRESGKLLRRVGSLHRQPLEDGHRIRRFIDSIKGRNPAIGISRVVNFVQLDEVRLR
jgi:hypothetical protein